MLEHELGGLVQCETALDSRRSACSVNATIAGEGGHVASAVAAGVSGANAADAANATSTHSASRALGA